MNDSSGRPFRRGTRPGGAADLPERFCFREDADASATTEEDGGVHVGHTAMGDTQSEGGQVRGQSAGGETSTVGEEMEILRPRCRFAGHILEWRSQTLPAQLAALGPGKALLVKYEPEDTGAAAAGAAAGAAAADGVGASRDDGGGGCGGGGDDDEMEWPFDDSLLPGDEVTR